MGVVTPREAVPIVQPIVQPVVQNGDSPAATMGSAVLARACAWIDSRLETSFRLAPFDGDRREGPFWASLRAIAELAHASDVLLRNPRPGAAALGRRWLEHA